MIQPKLRHLPLAAAALVACSGAMAGYQSPDGNFTLSGFGTLGAAKTSTDDVEFVYPGQRGGATKSVSFNPDSKLAVQGTYKFTPTFSATTQVMTKFDGEGQYEPKAEWVFGKWQATPSLAIRAGRMGAPYFMISDFRDVGYANLAVRPQLEVYGQVPVSQFEGADIAYQTNLGDATITSTLWAGDSHTKYTSALNKSANTLDVKQTVGLNINADLGNGFTLRLGHTIGKINVKNESGDQLKAGANSQVLRGGLQQAIGQLNTALANAPLVGLPDTHPNKAAVITKRNDAQAALASLSEIYPLVNPDADKATFSGIGLIYDMDNWVVNTEVTKRTTKGFIADTTSWYLQVGYRINALTPYVGMSKTSTDRRSSNPVVKTNVGNAQLDGGVLALYNGVQQTLNTQKEDQKTITVGARWDVAPNVALKGQWDRTSTPTDSIGWFLAKSSDTELTSGSFTANKRSVNVFTISADFIF